MSEEKKVRYMKWGDVSEKDIIDSIQGYKRGWVEKHGAPEEMLGNIKRSEKKHPKCRHPLGSYKPVGREGVVYVCSVCEATYIIPHCKKCFSRRICTSTKTEEDDIRRSRSECECGYKWVFYDDKGVGVDVEMEYDINSSICHECLHWIYEVLKEFWEVKE